MKIRIGDKASLEKIFTKEDVVSFSILSLDINPLHLDEEYASHSIFKKPICHGFLVGSLISAVIANKLPGIGSIYLSQKLDFCKPVFYGDKIKAEVEVFEIIQEKKIVKLFTTCFNQNNELIIKGEAVLKVPSL
jgi:3-hydroxybutyryl-CoA dehydratase